MYCKVHTWNKTENTVQKVRSYDSTHEQRLLNNHKNFKNLSHDCYSSTTTVLLLNIDVLESKVMARLDTTFANNNNHKIE